MQSGLVFNLQKYSVQDGPGIRTTVFLKGCPLCCSWCHNPEGISRRREIIVMENRCAACGECRKACPFAETIGGDGVLPARNELCTYCGRCVDACPSGARQMVGREMTVAEVMREALKDRVFYEDSGGGVTFSGGEPLMQPGFLRELLMCCRKAGIHTTVDTCGFTCTDRYLELAPFVSLFLYDVKLIDDARHRQHCGVSNQPIIENLKALGKEHGTLWIRVPVIPGVNNDQENLEGIAALLESICGIRQINLLPYHNTAAQKYTRLGRTPAVSDLKTPTPEQMQRAASYFDRVGVPVKIGG